MNKQNTAAQFARYVVPSVTGMLVSSLYVVVDGVFVGRGVGAHGIAAINLVWPFIAVFIAFSLMAGIGGAAMMSHALGADDTHQAQSFFGQAIWLSLGISVVFSLAGVLFTQPFCLFMGADSAIVQGCVDYLRWYMVFAVPYGLSMVLAAFVRNDNDPGLAFVAMVAGAVINVVLDYFAIIVLQGGIAGAAIATGIGQLCSMLMLSVHFLRHRGVLRLRLPRPAPRILAAVAHTGSPELLVNLCCPVSMLAYNQTLMARIGPDGVAAYGIIAYILTILTSLFTGVSQGIQPILSYSCGAGDKHSLRRFFRMGLGVNLTLSALLCLGLRLWDSTVIGIFTTDPALIARTQAAFVVYLPSCLFGAVNVICITYFLSVRQTRLANLISFSRGVVLILFFILVLPPLLGELGIWIAITAAEAATFLLAVGCFWALRRQAAINPPPTHDI